MQILNISKDVLNRLPKVKGIDVVEMALWAKVWMMVLYGYIQVKIIPYLYISVNLSWFMALCIDCALFHLVNWSKLRNFFNYYCCICKCIRVSFSKSYGNDDCYRPLILLSLPFLLIQMWNRTTHQQLLLMLLKQTHKMVFLLNLLWLRQNWKSM